ncbi:MAG: hypothetical protein COV07_03860 [Candidatus Vogelbacteria bacterium CG10_big_fil_rev_8_21_14_0_10_45_14]|uniref:Uncharacterized protein n=1 Tax=Candidatus Vogelbacteria bacterium CG10_big_fil_rev_8_21_14_0_10_45_14 TaxID=1975042 RepID=A0A2H0RL74_9BACT|nr:MAG: hypothetical protein COV07_03860 [Candidatus Vogelbacteria bacterium CG10_big_fil_rev_8_21_14_0_10_45_14]
MKVCSILISVILISIFFVGIIPMHAGEHGEMEGDCFFRVIVPGVDCGSLASLFGVTNAHIDALINLANYNLVLIYLLFLSLTAFVALMKQKEPLLQIVALNLVEENSVINRKWMARWLSLLQNSPNRS